MKLPGGMIGLGVGAGVGVTTGAGVTTGFGEGVTGCWDVAGGTGTEGGGATGTGVGVTTGACTMTGGGCWDGGNGPLEPPSLHPANIRTIPSAVSVRKVACIK